MTAAHEWYEVWVEWADRRRVTPPDIFTGANARERALAVRETEERSWKKEGAVRVRAFHCTREEIAG